ncbi:PstS family phosphate ABC transporter substrate-binding protein [Pseudomonas abyssi]|uniref:PstS family phosphate ABC transporter substrate-binding protein n=1 Tax=Pseudomonas abyssi TaxID=170540 RepID=UPI003C7C5E16
MTLSTVRRLTLSGLIAGLLASPAFASDTILADGSSTVFPITQEAAERSKLVVDNRFSGTTAGFRRFCAGETDISNASRPINREEMASCEAAGVRYVELPIAFDAIAIVVNGSNDWVRDITTDELKTLWQPQAEGQEITWQDLRAEWPDRPVSLFGRGSNSGTYDYFTAVINGETRASRSDYLASENEEELVEAMLAEPDALGFFGVGAYFRHWQELHDVAVDSGKGPVYPALNEVLGGDYQPLARPLFLYVNADALKQKATLRPFLEGYLDGVRHWLHVTGYMPLSVEAYGKAQQRLAEGQTGTRFGGELAVGLGLDELYQD